MEPSNRDPQTAPIDRDPQTEPSHRAPQTEPSGGGPRRGPLRRFFGGLWRGVDALRRFTFNILFLLLVILVLSLLLGSEETSVPDKAALVIAPHGELVEQLDGDALDRAVEGLSDGREPQTLLCDLLDAIAAARDDERIQALVLDLDGIGGAGLTKLQDLRDALTEFKTSGKTVIATADDYSQTGYYLAAQADEIYLHEMGVVLVPGYGRYRTYFKDGLDRLGVDVNVFRVGEYKSAVEPFLRDDMSEAAREANLDWLGDLWNAWVADVAAARGLTEEQVLAYSTGFPELLKQAAGSAARAALDAGLVDHIGNRDAVRDRLVELVGEDEETHSFAQISHAAYLTALGDDRPGSEEMDDRVAVLVARGEILDGDQPPGQIGGDSTAELIRRARNDEAIKALVLRVDSGGGSAFASEVIRRELELLREAGKPVVVSMGTVAASGGYWIATSSDQIWASPTTITGSIGIFGIVPTFQKPLAKYLGMRVDGVGTTPLAGAMRLDRELAPEARDAIQQIVNRGYQEFLERVSEARGLSTEQVDQIARGRVWSGEDAYQHGLVDNLGSLGDAVAAAAELAELETDAYSVEYLEQELDFSEQLMADLLSRGTAMFGLEGRLEAPLPAAFEVLGPLVGEHLLRDPMTRDLESVLAIGASGELVTHCMCEVR